MENAASLRVGINLPSTVHDIASYLADAVALEAAGVDSLWVADDLGTTPGVVGGLEPWTVLAALSAVTHRVLLGTAVSDVTVWPPAVFARMTASLDRLSRGRLVVGAASGGHSWWSRANGLEDDVAGERLDEFLTAVRGLWRGGGEAFTGRHYRVPALTMNAAGVRAGGPPVLIGATSPEGRRRAVQIGQGLIHPDDDREEVDAAFTEARAMLAARGSPEAFELWCQVRPPQGREDWAATLATCADVGATGVMVSFAAPLLDILRNPELDDDRVDLLLAQG